MLITCYQHRILDAEEIIELYMLIFISQVNNKVSYELLVLSKNVTDIFNTNYMFKNNFYIEENRIKIL